MKRLLAFCAVAGVLLNSATPPSEAVGEPSAPRPLALAAEPEVLPQAPAPPPEPIPAPTPPPPAEAPPPVEEVWQPPPSSIRILVSIPQQKAYVFDAGELVATSPVSTGKRGYETPVGTFPILQKKVHHRSNKYGNAPMPYMQRLTWGGVALHAGSVPGRPASHGCIRLPRKFAKKLYGLTNFGTTVTVTRERPDSPEDAFTLI